jgi:hypothetical protein
MARSVGIRKPLAPRRSGRALDCTMSARSIAIMMGVVSMVVATSCDRPRLAQPPAPFEVTSLATAPHPDNTNLTEVTGVVSVQDPALKGKTMLLRLRARAVFKAAGVTRECSPVEVIVTNGSGTLDTVFYVPPEDKKTIGREILSPSYSFEADGFTELHPAKVEVR